MKIYKLVYFVLIIGIVITTLSLFFGFKKSSTSLEKSDLIYIDCLLTDDPHLETTGGKNSTTSMVFQLDKFQGIKFRTPKEWITSWNVQEILALKSKSNVNVGFLKSDYRNLSGNNKVGLIEGFYKFSDKPVMTLSYDGTTLLDLYEVNQELKFHGTLQILGSSFFLFIFIIAIVKIRKSKSEASPIKTEQRKN